jgi:hypothetical protein
MSINKSLRNSLQLGCHFRRKALACRVIDHRVPAAFVVHLLLYAKARMVSNVVRRVVLWLCQDW